MQKYICVVYVNELKQKFDIEMTAKYAVWLFEDSMFVAEGVKKILYLSTTEIKLSVGKKMVVVKGRDMALTDAGLTQISIKGKIHGFEVVD